MKNIKKIAVVLAVAMLVLVPFVSVAALDVPSITQPSGDLTSNMQTTAGQIAGLIQILGIAVALVVVVAFGVQWLTAAPAKKAELKGKMWSIVIGVGIIVAGSSVLSWVIKFYEDNVKI